MTVRFEFTREPRIYWLVVDGEHPELCFNDPGRNVDLVVTADEQVFGAVLLGRAAFVDAVSQGDIRLDGPGELVRGFPTRLGVSRFARYAPAAGILAEARCGGRLT